MGMHGIVVQVEVNKHLTTHRRCTSFGAVSAVLASINSGPTSAEEDAVVSAPTMTDAVWRYHDTVMAAFPLALAHHIDAVLAAKGRSAVGSGVPA